RAAELPQHGEVGSSAGDPRQPSDSADRQPRHLSLEIEGEEAGAKDDSAKRRQRDREGKGVQQVESEPGEVEDLEEDQQQEKADDETPCGSQREPRENSA